jgi:hypothetical protein
MADMTTDDGDEEEGWMSEVRSRLAVRVRSIQPSGGRDLDEL